MTDRELLVLAAKALGDPKIVWNGAIWADNGRLQTADARGDRYPCIWNPLTDDGDALRLAVKLQMQITCFIVCTDASAYGKDNVREVDTSPYVATRRAIVRAAAEIGKAMP